MPRDQEPSRNDRGQGVAGVHTGTAWDAVWPAAARFTNWAARLGRDWTGGIVNFTGVHDTDLGPKKRKRFIAAGGEINPPGVKHKRGSPVYFWQGERIGKRRAFQVVRQIKRGFIPATPPLPIVNGPTAADQASGPYADYAWVAARGPRTRGRRRKKKSKLRGAAAVLAARVLQTGEEVFAGLLNRTFVPRGGNVNTAAREFERLLARDFVPGAARETIKVAARAAVSVAARAAGAAALLLWPSSIGREPPWSPPPGTRPAPPRPVAGPRAPAPRPDVRTMPRPQLPSPAPAPRARVSSPQSLPRAPVPTAQPLPAPRAVPRASSVPAPGPRSTAFPSWLLSPIAAGITASGNVPRRRRPVVVSTQRPPLTGFQPQPLPSPAGSNCDCQKPTRTRRERKKRCSNPVISRRRKGDTITTVRKIKCPA